MVRLAPGPAGMIDEVPAARLYKDGALLISAQARTVAERRRLGFAGIVVVALAVSEKGELLADPEVELIGIPEQTADKAVDARDRLRGRARDLRVDAEAAPARPAGRGGVARRARAIAGLAECRCR